jgi:xanthine/uracil/vitamin C permease (AzgA family)
MDSMGKEAEGLLAAFLALVILSLAFNVAAGLVGGFLAYFIVSRGHL